MLPTIVYKLTAVLLMAVTVLATTPEADREQPTKLLGGIYPNYTYISRWTSSNFCSI